MSTTGWSSQAGSRQSTPGSQAFSRISLGNRRLQGAFNSFEDEGGEDDAGQQRTGMQDELVNEISGADFIGSRRPEVKASMVIPLIKKNQWRGIANGSGASSPGSEDMQIDVSTLSQSVTGSRPRSPENTPTATETVTEESHTTTVAAEGATAGGKQWGLQVMKKRKVVVMDDTTTTVTETTRTETVTVTDERPPEPMTVDDEALAAVLRDAAEEQEDGRPRISYLPILAENAVPGLEGLEDVVEKYRHDVNLRPDESTMDDYERVPIEEFGKALLRGMGWEQGRAVGKNPNGLTEPISLKSRPHLLGLGATPAPVLEVKQKKYIKPGEKRQADPLADVRSRPVSTDVPRTRREKGKTDIPPPPPPQDAVLRVGDKVTVTAGRHEGQSGVITEIEVRDSGTVAKVELSKTGEVARVWLEDLTPRRSSSTRESSSSRLAPSSSLSSPSSSSWLRPHIRVRIISKSLDRGRHYNQKGIIQDVFSADQCVVRLDSGHLVDAVRTKHVETIIPAATNTHVCVVQYEKDPNLVGHLGILKENHKEEERVVVQMEADLQYYTFTYDEVAEYVE
ncbi:hypothetical protein PhCBS80983_g00591 [Powellomyces hirtus]|uniref:G-patch domain-containing protein n=1 Tax=Powellomyces hirtus TaxID=109895 RepID=A0A507EEP8_9FUNG|nr:hypothetical protein PhCBS80983_g00591 [Powellomyces hirtus]